MVDFSLKDKYNVQDLVDIVKVLRAPGGCQWDAQQTHESIRRNFLEEAYEVAEAIDQQSTEHRQEELGDVLLQVVFHTCIEEEEGRFNLDDVANGVCQKLIFRHPHVFGDVTVSSTGEILANWEELKKKEKGQATQADAVDAVARSLPALWRAEKVQKKAAPVGFDWDSVDGAVDKRSEELGEVKEAIAGHGDPAEGLGDLLFAAVNVDRFLKVDPEDALQAACDKFAARFRRVEEEVTAQGKQMEDMSLTELDDIWNAIKHQP